MAIFYPPPVGTQTDGAIRRAATVHRCQTRAIIGHTGIPAGSDQPNREGRDAGVDLKTREVCAGGDQGAWEGYVPAPRRHRRAGPQPHKHRQSVALSIKRLLLY